MFFDCSSFGGSTLLFKCGRFRCEALLFQGGRLGGEPLLFGLALLFDEGNRCVGLHAPPADLNPDVVAAAGRDHVEAVVAKIREPVLHGAKFLERRQHVRRQQLRHHPDGGVQREFVCRNVQRIGSHNHVGTLADVHHQRVAVGANDCGQK